jgi:Type II secretion system (T2SS), protein E, N-terminal domain
MDYASAVAKALSQQRASGSGRIGDWLVAECGLETEQVTRGLSVQWGCPVVSLDGFSPVEMALVMPRIFVEKFGMLPLRVAGSRLIYLGCADRPDASVAFAVERMSGLKTESGLVDAEQLGAARSRLLECQGVSATIEAAADEDALAARVTAVLEQKQPLASRLVRLHQYYWLRIWLESGTKGKAGTVPASDEDMQDYIFTIGARA